MSVDVVRLSVNISPTVAEALREVVDTKEITFTAAIGRAIAVLKIVTDANNQGHRVMVVEGTGAEATYREVIVP